MKNFTIELSEEELNVLGAALDERPYKEVYRLALRIQEQIIRQNTADFAKTVEAAIQHRDKAALPDLPEAPKANGSAVRGMDA
jgi:hypothetical protein